MQIFIHGTIGDKQIKLDIDITNPTMLEAQEQGRATAAFIGSLYSELVRKAPVVMTFMEANAPTFVDLARRAKELGSKVVDLLTPKPETLKRKSRAKAD